jgi:polysaccharide biosynthesis protein PslG
MPTSLIHKVGAYALALLFVLILAAGCGRGDDDPFQAGAITQPNFTSLTYGVQTFAWWDTATTAPLHMEWTRLMGFTHIKQTFAWQDIELRDDEWKWTIADQIVAMANEKNLHIVARLSNAPDWAHPSLPPQVSSDYIDAPPDDPAEFGEYCGTLAQRYQGRIAAYQVWNEPNLTREWGNRPPNAADYVALLAACSDGIRQADPDAIIISAGLSPTGNYDDTAHADDIYLQAMYDAGFEQYVDVVGVHAPGWGKPPDYGPDEAEADGRGRWATFRRVEDMRQIMIENDDAKRQIAILELGYTTDQVHPEYQWHAVTEAQQREYLVGAYTYAAENWRPWVGLISTIYLAEQFWTPEDEEYWWALNEPEGPMRPAFAGLAQMPKICGENVLPARNPEESAVAPEYNPCN